jgi:hypothetical protein
VKEGFGIYTYSDGSRYEGEWSNGLQHGKGKIVDANGKIVKGVWEAGIKKKK